MFIVGVSQYRRYKNTSYKINSYMNIVNESCGVVTLGCKHMATKFKTLEEAEAGTCYIQWLPEGIGTVFIEEII